MLTDAVWFFMSMEPEEYTVLLMVSLVPARIGRALLLLPVTTWSTISHRPGLSSVNVACLFSLDRVDVTVVVALDASLSARPRVVPSPSHGLVVDLSSLAWSCCCAQASGSPVPVYFR